VSPAKDLEDEDALPHPRETAALFGHAEAERTLLEAYKGGRIPHAWLIGGEAGIGKATLAYRMATFVLAHPDPAAPAVQKATSLAVPADRPVARRVASQSHTDLLTLERVFNEKTGKLFTTIRVDDVRRTVSFFGSTAGEGGWRIAIVDHVEELERAGENALLKVLEEPPPRSLLFLISNAPGRVLPTIRSRCRLLMLRPLPAEDVAKAAAAVLGQISDDTDIVAAAQAADGSVGRALMFLDGPALELRQRILGLLEGLPQLDQRALHLLGDKLGGVDSVPLLAFMETVNSWLSGQLATSGNDKRRMARLAEAWDKVNTAGRDTEEYNLDRRPFVFSVFGALAEAARA
jgi:DNA polymerase III subunit delta'